MVIGVARTRWPPGGVPGASIISAVLRIRVSALSSICL